MLGRVSARTRPPLRLSTTAAGTTTDESTRASTTPPTVAQRGIRHRERTARAAARSSSSLEISLHREFASPYMISHAVYEFPTPNLAHAAILHDRYCLNGFFLPVAEERPTNRASTQRYRAGGRAGRLTYDGRVRWDAAVVQYTAPLD
ncbi:uncharacterized protein SCHCODRAFT_02704336 [Schizophyllum commune H4-8]|uniref:uncharacterized protein n=1 Tax=Schizophyllum commune (strain H4-8 / FGSC 9210) TaxID=578458 RepID=UPI00215F7685|nr:uncharacterized protein SCHCODRAFT_02704336 [Schizophyllum commune H4-8]KAI5888346.1 hypothetical protein SCHCODRAFT_02704336 [Schizophyllum commune H4-8]